jgi:membrane protein implicated in regulation of membrane protease activity
MNGIGSNTEISKIIFWPVKLSFVLAIIFWGLAAFCAVRWHRRRKAWKAKKQSADTND